MQANQILSVWKRERLGLMMVIASLAVITVIVGILFVNQQKSEMENIRKQGISLAKLLSQMSFDQVVPPTGKQGAFAVLQHNQEQTSFSYLVVVDTSGRQIAEISSSGVIAPAIPVPSSPSEWLEEKTLSLPGNGKQVVEFHAPLFNDSKLAGHIRLGYFKPGLGFSSKQVPFLATLALPIFLLAPLFYFLIRREIRPLQKANSQLDELVRQGTLNKMEITATGELHEFMNHLNGFIGSAQDRIKQLESERSGFETTTKLLSYKRSRIDSVLQSMPDALMVLDESGAVSFANSRFNTLLKVSPGDILSKKPVEWCDNQDVVAFLSDCTRKSAHGFNRNVYEFSPRATPDKTVSVSSYPLFSPREPDQLLGTLVLFRDVTAEILAKQSSGAFIAHVAHELKSPLNVIAMYSETLQNDDGKDDAFRIEASNIIHDETERLTQLINNILSITKIEMGSISIERKRVKLRDLIQDTCDTNARNANAKDLAFEADIPREMSPVAADKDLLRIALNNLLTNAIKYSDPGGKVSLTAEEDENSIRISIRDNGIGIAPDEQKKIFEKFYRSERDDTQSRNGHGLGLSLAQEIIQLHGGTLTLNSTLGAGSEFVIDFRKETDLLKQAV
ncbi:MAG: ATP-binding protein [Gammaproteobacteria bacterium]